MFPSCPQKLYQRYETDTQIEAGAEHQNQAHKFFVPEFHERPNLACEITFHMLLDAEGV